MAVVLVGLDLAVVLRDLRFFFLDPAPPEIYTLSLHDALPILMRPNSCQRLAPSRRAASYRSTGMLCSAAMKIDRKSTRLNSSHEWISYAVFCLKKKTFEADRVILTRLPTGNDVVPLLEDPDVQ